LMMEWSAFPVKLTFHGGVGEIGGNKILLEDGSNRIFLDFGKNYSKERNFFDFPLLQPRQEKHLLATGILPNLPGMYKQDTATPDIAGILLSHPHGDHWDYIRFVKDTVPVGCGAICKTVIVAREQSTKLGPSEEYYVANLTKTAGPKINKAFQTFKEKATSNFCGIQFTAYEVDHSIPGSCGFVLHTSSGNLVYTGDLRFSGPKGSLSKEFMRAAKASDPEALIIEGTNIVEANISSEDEVKAKITLAVKETPQLVMVGCNITDLDRLQTLYEVAKANDRQIAITMKQAFMIDSLRSAGLAIFDVADENVLIFQKEKKGVHEFEKQIEAKYQNTIRSSDIPAQQKKLLLILGFYEFNELVEINPEGGSIYILSQSEPFNEEMELQFDKLKQWLATYGVALYLIHSSGHATPHELRRFIAEVKPKKTFLIHTEQPELYKRFISDLHVDPILPLQGQEVTV
jgi:ribonuclease J